MYYRTGTFDSLILKEDLHTYQYSHYTQILGHNFEFFQGFNIADRTKMPSYMLSSIFMCLSKF